MAWLPRKKESVSFFLGYSEAKLPTEPLPRIRIMPTPIRVQDIISIVIRGLVIGA